MSTAPLRFVVVDDSLELLDQMEEALTEIVRGPISIRIFDEAPTLDELADERPDVVMLNLRLGGEAAGWELVHELRTDHQLTRIPVIICTTDLHRVLAGVTGLASIDGLHLLAKPFSLIELEAVIARVVPPAALSTGTAAPDIAASPLVVGGANVGQSVHPEVADA